MSVMIFHNPRCSKSRETLALLEQHGITPVIVKYLETPPDATTLRNVLVKLGLSARDLLRTGESVYAELGLSDPSLSDEQLINAMAAHPELIQRPIVISGEQARLGRPPEAVLEIVG